MNAERDRGKPRLGWLRLPLLFLAASTLGGSLWALPFPRSFYEDFPAPGWGWVSTLGPYNEHLVRDYGAMNLALGVLLVSAAISPERRLTQVALLTYLAFATPHLLFHMAQIHHFSLFHNALQLSTLGFLVLLPAVLLALTRKYPESVHNEVARKPAGRERKA